MPIIARQCIHGHTKDEFVHTHQDIGVRTLLCPECQCTMGKILSMGQGLCWFEEGRGRWIPNIAKDPLYITSHEQHKRLMKEYKVDWATEGRGRKTGWI